MCSLGNQIIAHAHCLRACASVLLTVTALDAAQHDRREF